MSSEAGARKIKRIVVASENPVKCDAAIAAFERMFPQEEFDLSSIAVKSGVDEQPMSDRETLRGAQQRAENARIARPDADFWVGIEGGVEDHWEGMLALAWIVVLGKHREGKGRTGGFMLPEAVARRVRVGVELGEANDAVFSRHNSKQQEGAIGILTNGVLDRRELYEHGVVLALAPFKTSQIYDDPGTDSPAGDSMVGEGKVE